MKSHEIAAIVLWPPACTPACLRAADFGSFSRAIALEVAPLEDEKPRRGVAKGGRRAAQVSSAPASGGARGRGTLCI